jgi:hypothetical protein
VHNSPTIEETEMCTNPFNNDTVEYLSSCTKAGGSRDEDSQQYVTSVHPTKEIQWQ